MGNVHILYVYHIPIWIIMGTIHIEDLSQNIPCRVVIVGKRLLMYNKYDKDNLRITKWLPSEVKHNSKYGVVTYHEFLINEQSRFSYPTEIITEIRLFSGVPTRFEALVRIHFGDVPTLFQMEKI